MQSSTTTGAFAAALRPVETAVAPVGLLGFEHEYKLISDGHALDFRDLIHDLAVPGLRLDPGDTNAYRCTSGLAVTCDDEEAEVASPPLPLTPSFTSELDDWAAAGRALLTQIIPPSITLAGYSTHLSAAIPDEHADRIADLFVHTFAPALMLVLDRRDSHGVFVRPRPSRLELCGEYAIGDRLRAASAFFAGGVRACATTMSEHGGSPLPAPLAVDALVALGRHGLEVDRQIAFGFDLYAQGRDAVLPLHSGGTIDAQSYLESAWGSARGALKDHADADDLVPAEAMVRGSAPLGIEANRSDHGPAARPLAQSPFGDLVAQRDRGTFITEPVLATWHFTVFGLRGVGRVAYACVPRAHLAVFLNMLDAGKLDGILSAYLQSPPSGRVLTAFAQTGEPGLWDEVGVPTDLLPPERKPVVEDGVPLPSAKASRRRSGPMGLTAHRGEVGAGAPSAAGASAVPGTPGSGSARYGKPVVPAQPRRRAPSRFEGTPPPPPLPPPTIPPEPPPPPREGRGGSRRNVRLVVALIVGIAVLVAIAFAIGLFGGSNEKVRVPAPSTTVSEVTTEASTVSESTLAPVSTVPRTATVPPTRATVRTAPTAPTPSTTGSPVTTRPPVVTTTTRLPSTTTTVVRP